MRERARWAAMTVTFASLLMVKAAAAQLTLSASELGGAAGTVGCSIIQTKVLPDVPF